MHHREPATNQPPERMMAMPAASEAVAEQRIKHGLNKRYAVGKFPMDIDDAVWAYRNEDQRPVPGKVVLAQTAVPQNNALTVATIPRTFEPQFISLENDAKIPHANDDPRSVKAQAGWAWRYQSIGTSASLERYILQAEQLYLPRFEASRDIFIRAPGVNTPTLEKDRSNRVLVFTGCFNPPHRGHRELLLHTYLRTDDSTIAVIVAPRNDTHLGSKYLVQSHGFTRKQRDRLWQDELLQRFTWVYPGSHRDVNDFVKRMSRLAKIDGFRLTFTTVRGSDHTTLDEEPNWSGGTGSLITSDITRPSELIKQGDGVPYPVAGCSKWRKILPYRSVQKPEDEDACWPCWPCSKLSKVYPQFRGMRASMECLPDDLQDILQRCHPARNIIWLASRPVGGIFWFFPSGRQYPIDNRRPSVSSTIVRKLLSEYNGDHEALYEALRPLVFNPGLLITMMRMNKCWWPRYKVDTWVRVSISEKTDDDWEVAERGSASKRTGGQSARRNSL
jgi:hypothetical protein